MCRIIVLSERGVYGSVIIKKYQYLLKDIRSDGIQKYFTSKKVSNFCFLKLWNRKENAIKIAVLIIKTEYISCIVDC